jgi:beta-xylosidase
MNRPNQIVLLKMVALTLLLTAICGNVASVADVSNRGKWGDQGDGTFKNPILPGDFSDPDVIRVGGDYYFITSTFQYSPGMAVLHSKDLVNWQYVGHCVADLPQLGPELNWDRMNRYNRGIYAGALRFHNGKFWVFFTTMDEGVFMTTAAHAAGPWSPVTRVWDKQGFDDPCPFWEDDGQAYLLLSSPGKQWWTRIYKMSSDGSSVDPASEKILDNYQSSEGNKIYKINGVYYVFHNEYHRASNVRVGVMMRAKSLNGPWEKKTILEDSPEHYDRQPNQGGLIQTRAGDWWFITQQGRGESGEEYVHARRGDADSATPRPMDKTGTYDGRPANLLPVKWVDGWPLPGTINKNGVGNLIWTGKKPVNGFPIEVPQSSDDFTTAKLGPQWEWNHQPRQEKWSLTARPGWLRMHAFKPLLPGDFFKAGNTLTQRVMGTGEGAVEVKMDASRMADGQIAGLVFFWKNYAQIGVAQKNGQRNIVFNENEIRTEGPKLLPTDLAWVRAKIDDQGGCSFTYSLDGKTFTPIGTRFFFGWFNYRGTRLGLFTYNDLGEHGWVDFDSFHYDYREETNELNHIQYTVGSKTGHDNRAHPN